MSVTCLTITHSRDRGTGDMAYVITQPCIDVKDTLCADFCPVSYIYLESDKVDRKLYIHPDECFECGAREPDCPVNAIFHESTVPPEWAEFTELDKRWCTGDDSEKSAVRGRLPPRLLFARAQRQLGRATLEGEHQERSIRSGVNGSERSHGLFFITDKCVGCRACELVCPVTAITGVKKEFYFVDPKICIDCGACGRACPYDAILDTYGKAWLATCRTGDPRTSRERMAEHALTDFPSCQTPIPTASSSSSTTRSAQPSAGSVARSESSVRTRMLSTMHTA